MLLSLLLAASPGLVAAQEPVKTPAEAEGAIVVTGERLADTEAALKNCIARGCPPREDIDATLRHVENLFVSGDYKLARTTMLASLGRNRRFAAQYPTDVADLLRANGRVAVHLGEGSAYQSAVVDVLRVLRQGYGKNDPRTLEAELDLADSYARFGRPDEAARAFARVASRAHDLGLPMVEGQALLRTAILYGQYAEVSPGIYAPLAARAIATLTSNADPRMASYAKTARLLQVRLLMKQGDTSGAETIIASLKADPTATTPVLVYAPLIDLPERSNQLDTSNVARLGVNTVDKQWVDISFWVAPDGRVTEAGVLRQSPTLSGNWVKPVLTAINGRRYAPLALAPSDPGILRVERYTFTARWTSLTGSHIRSRSPQPRIEVLDLSTDGLPPRGAAL